MPEQVTAAAGQPFTVVVADGAGGYRWMVRDLPEGLQLVGDEPVEGQTLEVGSPAPRRLTFVADRPGAYRVDLALQRSWERDTDPVRTHAVEVEVSDR
jgi:predicted secreted protein